MAAELQAVVLQMQQLQQMMVEQMQKLTEKLDEQDAKIEAAAVRSAHVATEAGDGEPQQSTQDASGIAAEMHLMMQMMREQTKILTLLANSKMCAVGRGFRLFTCKLIEF